MITVESLTTFQQQSSPGRDQLPATHSKLEITQVKRGWPDRVIWLSNEMKVERTVESKIWLTLYLTLGNRPIHPELG